MSKNWDPDKESLSLRVYRRIVPFGLGAFAVFIVATNLEKGISQTFFEGVLVGVIPLLIILSHIETKRARERAEIAAKFSAGKPPSADWEHYS